MSSFGRVQVQERIWRKPGKSYMRLLPEVLNIPPKGFTRRLQRILCNFAWDQSFNEANERLREHYGFELCVERIRQTALSHAKAIEQSLEQREAVGRLPAEGADFITTSADGTMIRLVQTGQRGDRRKVRELHWKEARLAASQSQGDQRIHYEATFGNTEALGLRWAHSVRAARWGCNSTIHAVTDGAAWLREQAAQNLGTNHHHTLDLYHVCEYLGAAAPVCAQRESPTRWLTRHKNMLLKGKIGKVVCNLQSCLEPEHVDEEDAPVRRAYRYLNSRRESLDYPWALQRNLPVGSGIIEGGNRHVIQRRLKGSGMAWKIENAQALCQARCLKCSGKLEAYWQKSLENAA